MTGIVSNIHKYHTKSQNKRKAKNKNFKLFFNNVVKILDLSEILTKKGVISLSFIQFNLKEYIIHPNRSSKYFNSLIKNLFIAFYLSFVELLTLHRKGSITSSKTNYLNIISNSVKLQYNLIKLYYIVFVSIFSDIKSFKNWFKLNNKKTKMITKHVLSCKKQSIASFTFYRCTNNSKKGTRFLDYRNSF
mmetsp:Transcript_15466/g.21533  ORF Transcript_15466/g.21533 Transcript_15466/m.21533 type:complete len:190 (-) Transcript_15466:2475-3044(-)